MSDSLAVAFCLLGAERRQYIQDIGAPCIPIGCGTFEGIVKGYQKLESPISVAPIYPALAEFDLDQLKNG